MNPQPLSGYPCPACRAPADLVNGCSGCGRLPDPVAAEVVSLNETITSLAGRERQYLQELAALRAQLASSRQRRDRLAAEVRGSVGTAAAPSDAPSEAPAEALSGQQSVLPQWLRGTAAATGPAVAGISTRPAGGATAAASTPATRAPEVSGSGVQTLLFVVGGLLLGTGAVVFMIVAWTRFGLVGRAGTLVLATGLALAAPALARWRRLPGTAETIAVIGMLLVLLDGYAAWRAGLVSDLPGSRWAGLVCGGTALVSLGYARATRLVSPRFVGLVLAQPVLPLLAVTPARELPQLSQLLTVLSLTGGVVAAGDLAVCWRLRRATGLRTGLRILSWVAAGSALAAATVVALLAVALASSPPLALFAGAGLLAGVTVLGLLAAVAGGGGWSRLAAAAAVLAVALAGARVTVLSWPAAALVGVAAVTSAAALVAAVIAGLRRPARGSAATGGRSAVRSGCRVGGVVAVGAVAGYAAGLSLWAGLSAAWLAPQRPGGLELGSAYDWQLPVGLILVTVALAALLPARRAEVTAGGVVLLALALPAALELPWWTPIAVDLPVAAGLALLTAAAARRRAAVAGTVAAAGLLLHALLVSSASAASIAAVLGTLVLLGPAVAVRAAGGGPRTRRVISRAGLLVGLLAWPGAVAAGLTAAGLNAPWPGRLALLATAGLLAVVAWTSARAGNYTGTAAAAVHAVTPVAVLAGLAEAGASGSAYPTSAAVTGYGGAAVLVLAALGLLRPPGRRDRWLAPRIPPVVLVAVLAAPPLAGLLFGPYGWLERVWSGRPAGVGLLAGGELAASGPTTMGLLLVAIAAGVAGRVLTGRWRSGAVAGLLVGSAAGLVGLVWLAAPWPVVPVTSLLGGAGALLWAARWGRGGRAAVAGGYGLALTGAGLAGSLPMRWSTVTALTLVTLLAVAIALAGRVAPVRVAGWLGSAGAGTLLAVAVTRAVAAPAPVTGFAVLAVAAALLAASARVPIALTGFAGPGSRAGGLAGSGAGGDGGSGGVAGTGSSAGGDTAAAPGGAAPGTPAVHDPERPPVVHDPERLAAELAGHAAAAVALLLSLGSLRFAAVVAIGWGVALGLRALRPGGSAGGRIARGVAAGGCQLLAWWLLLAGAQVSLVEAYTVPAAAVGLVAAGWLRRHRPSVGSWISYAPPLAAGLLPTLALTVVDPDPTRRLLLGTAAVLVLVVGARQRLQAPVAIGGGLAVVAALRELALVWQRLDAWIPLTVAGLLLVALAATYERRRRDLRRVAAALRGMS